MAYLNRQHRKVMYRLQRTEVMARDFSVRRRCPKLARIRGLWQSPGKIIARVRERTRLAQWRADGRRVVEISSTTRNRRGTRSAFDLPVVYVGDEAGQRQLFRINYRTLRRSA